MEEIVLHLYVSNKAHSFLHNTGSKGVPKIVSNFLHNMYYMDWIKFIRSVVDDNDNR